MQKYWGIRKARVCSIRHWILMEWKAECKIVICGDKTILPRPLEYFEEYSSIKFSSDRTCFNSDTRHSRKYPSSTFPIFSCHFELHTFCRGYTALVPEAVRYGPFVTRTAWVSCWCPSTRPSIYSCSPLSSHLISCNMLQETDLKNKKFPSRIGIAGVPFL